MYLQLQLNDIENILFQQLQHIYFLQGHKEQLETQNIYQTQVSND